MIDEEQLDEKDAAMYKADDEVVMEEKECNGDEPSSIVSTEDLKQTNEGEKNELLKCEISMQLQARQQLSYPHNNKTIYCTFQGNGTVLEDIAAYTQEELAEDVENSSDPTGLEETHSESLLPTFLSTQKKHLEIRRSAEYGAGDLEPFTGFFKFAVGLENNASNILKRSSKVAGSLALASQGDAAQNTAVVHETTLNVVIITTVDQFVTVKRSLERSSTKQNMVHWTVLPVREVSHWSECITSERPVAGYMYKIGSDGEKSYDACIDGSTRPAVVFCCTCHDLLCSYCHEYHKHSQKLSNHPTVEFALTLQNEQLMKMQDEIGRYTEMTSHILQTHTDHEMVAFGDLLSTKLTALQGQTAKG
ncbi:hypothetical protein EMCRGX_G014069 [Ephydatia muelleri]